MDAAKPHVSAPVKRKGDAVFPKGKAAVPAESCVCTRVAQMLGAYMRHARLFEGHAGESFL